MSFGSLWEAMDSEAASLELLSKATMWYFEEVLRYGRWARMAQQSLALRPMKPTRMGLVVIVDVQ